MRTSLSILLAALTFAALLPATLQAETLGDFYIVEVTLFTHDNPENANEGVWRKDISLRYPEPLAFLSKEAPNTIYPQLPTLVRQAQNEALPEDTEIVEEEPTTQTTDHVGPVFLPILDKSWQRHGGAAASIAGSSRYSVIYRQSWLQKMDNEKNAPHVVIQAGKVQSGIHEIGGTLQIFRERYLQLRTNLWKVSFASGTDNGSATAQQEVMQESSWPLPPQLLIPDVKTTRQAIKEGSFRGVLPAPVPSSATNAINRIVTLQEKRKMRSREVHYIDHPLLGMLIEIRPYRPDPPASGKPVTTKKQ